MAGYYTDYGFMGLVNGEYMLFATDTEYLEYVTDDSPRPLESLAGRKTG